MAAIESPVSNSQDDASGSVRSSAAIAAPGRRMTSSCSATHTYNAHVPCLHLSASVTMFGQLFGHCTLDETAPSNRAIEHHDTSFHCRRRSRGNSARTPLEYNVLSSKQRRKNESDARARTERTSEIDERDASSDVQSLARSSSRAPLVQAHHHSDLLAMTPDVHAVGYKG